MSESPLASKSSAEIELSIKSIMDQLVETPDTEEIADLHDIQDRLLFELTCRAQRVSGNEAIHTIQDRTLILRCTDRASHPSRQLATIYEIASETGYREFTVGDKQRFGERERPDVNASKSPDYFGFKAFRPICPSCKGDRPLGQETLRKLFDGLEEAGKFETRPFASVDVSLIPGTFRQRSN